LRAYLPGQSQCRRRLLREVPIPYGPILATILGSEAGSIFEPLITSGKVDELAYQAQIAV
jgi:hypothetical protein